MRRGHKVLLLTGAAVAASAAVAQPQQKVTGPVAVYWVSAATQSGFGVPGAGGGGGGRPSMSQIMQMMNGGGGAQHTLVLQLGSTEKATAAPEAEHLPPQALGVGASIPLVTPEPPKVVTPEPQEPQTPQIPREYQQPKGKMLIFWGCGEHARPGQPVVIDFSQMTPANLAAGKMPQGMEMLSKGMNLGRMTPPSARRYATYGEWPNAKARTTVPGTGSLVGAHTIHGDYSPEIKFTINQNQDFLGPLVLTTNTKTPGGPAQLGWGAVSGARAYAAMVIGASGQRGGGDPQVVLWSSSEIGGAGFAMPDYISPGDLARGVESHALMGPEQTSCAVPKEVVDAAPQSFLQMVAYGQEADFVYPERPRDPKIPWNQQWTVKVRYRSATGGLLGMATPGIGGAARGSPAAAQSGQDQPPPDPAAARRRAILNGLGGLIPH